MEIASLSGRRAVASPVALVIDAKQAHVRLIHALGPRRRVVHARSAGRDARQHLERAVHAQAVREYDYSFGFRYFPRIPSNLQVLVVREVARARDLGGFQLELWLPLLLRVGVHDGRQERPRRGVRRREGRGGTGRDGTRRDGTMVLWNCKNDASLW